MAADFYFTPELRLKDGRIIRNIEDALNFAREQEARPGVDQRDEILHKMERAESEEATPAGKPIANPPRSRIVGGCRKPEVPELTPQVPQELCGMGNRFDWIKGVGKTARVRRRALPELAGGAAETRLRG
jgi:hypothetical protein